MEKERRAFAIEGLELREVEGKTPMIVGHAAVFNSESRDLGGFIEVIAPGAFAGHEDLDVKALNNHDTGQVLGRNTAGTLRLREDDTGLAFEIDPPDTSFARDLAVSLERGDITQTSFGFRTITDKWETRDGMDYRTLEKVELLEISIVPFPAYPDTDVAMRSLEAYRESKEAKPPAKEEKQEDPGLSIAMADKRLQLAERD